MPTEGDGPPPPASPRSNRDRPGRGDAARFADIDRPGRIRSRMIHDGRVVHLTVDTVRYPDGSTGELEMIRHSGASAVLPVLDPIDTDDPRVLLIRQYRYAASGELLEVPAGRPRSPGEPWEDCARRELEEEVGLVAGRLVPLTTIFTTPGFTDERIHVFLGLDCTPGTTRRDRDEFIEPVELRLSEALRLARDGGIDDAKTLCTLLHFHAFRADLPH